jgi:mannose-6-phosphate isomerase-like protein (cupin superfamily)
VEDRAAPYVLDAGETRRDDAILPFKALASDTGGLLSVCEFTLGGWETGPVLHRHDAVDEAFYVVAGRLEAQLDDQRVQVAVGGFLWVPRGTAHTFANAGPEGSRFWPSPSPAESRSCSLSKRPISPRSRALRIPACSTRSESATALPLLALRSAPTTPRRTAQRRSPLPDA